MAIPYLTDIAFQHLKNIPDLRLLVDSGAFTAWKAGTEVTIDQYCNTIFSLPVKPWNYFTLDVVGEHEKTLENYKNIKANGLDPIPIFTRGDKLKTLEYYYSQNETIALGGLVGTMGNKGFVKGIMGHIGKRNVHWLGFTNLSFLSYYKPFSCDSSSMFSGLRYGHLPLYCGGGKFVIVSRDNFKQHIPKQLKDLFQLYEEDYNLFCFKENWKHSANKSLMRISFKSFCLLQAEVEIRFGTKYFLAVSAMAEYYLEHLNTAYLFWKDRFMTSTQFQNRLGLRTQPDQLRQQV